ncbi:amidase [Streptomyces pinistramenti]|uniref:amidase n=1 Tax=Streptomyces pinistramenti TaxID=2884812 RepID=UPI001D07FA50|nr:amidase family protein [Streptomyces pinistramenti]MCB5906282.1 amidase [Streptomyces pinistramenti]
MDDSLRHTDTVGLRRLYETGALSPTAFLQDTLDLIDAQQPSLGAFVTVAADQARAAAAEAEARIRALGAAAWDEQPLLGVPVSVKDLTATRGLRTTRGSLRLRDATPDEDAPAVARLRKAGAVILGKTTTSEGGWSAATVNRLGPAAANPWDTSLSAGGSSGGAAAAVAAGLGIAATGTDGAGSIRIPAAFCGVVGFKPTHGRIPYVPHCPDRHSHLGPLTRTVADAGLLADVMTGADPRDPDSYSARHGGQLPVPARPLRIAWIETPGPAAADHLTAPQRAAVQALADEGHRIERIPLPFDDPYPALVTILAAAEAAGSPPEHDAWADPERLRIVEHGRRLGAADLVHAEAARGGLRTQLAACTDRFDLLAMPTLTVEPFPVDAWRPADGNHDPLSWLAWAPAAYPFNLAGMPALSLPVGLSARGLPVGLQLAAAPGHDALVLHVAREIERSLPSPPTYPGEDRRQT